jgi:YspA, cpYpsA-related SLOG family
MRVVVTGGRYYADQGHVWSVLDAIHIRTPISILMHGGATGADALAAAWAVVRNVPVEEFKADWKKYGKSAGPRRNHAMLEYGDPDLVVAFPGHDGTADMIDQTRRAQVALKIVS